MKLKANPWIWVSVPSVILFTVLVAGAADSFGQCRVKRLHRHHWVRLRTRIENALPAMALAKWSWKYQIGSFPVGCSPAFFPGFFPVDFLGTLAYDARPEWLGHILALIGGRSRTEK